MVMLFILVAVVCVMSSTKEQRAAARARLKPFGRILWIPIVLFWAAVFITWPHH